jgi:hypothetical protein
LFALAVVDDDDNEDDIDDDESVEPNSVSPVIAVEDE